MLLQLQLAERLNEIQALQLSSTFGITFSFPRQKRSSGMLLARAHLHCAQ
jgi:hypothetical protein